MIRVRLLAWLAAGASTLSFGAAAGTDPAVPPGWTAVLERFVDARGRVDFTALARDHADLDAAVAYVAATNPASQPALFADRDTRLAYYINAYNALSMHNVIRSGTPDTLGALRRIQFFVLTKFDIGDTRMSLKAFEDDVIRPMGDERVHFALNCMSVGCPRLPREPFTRSGLQRQLDAAAREFLAESRNVQVDEPMRRVRLSQILDFYSDDFLRQGESLVAYVNRYRAPPIPLDFGVVFIPYDWTINARPPGG